MGRRIQDQVDDKTRILMTIIRELATTQVLSHTVTAKSEKDWEGWNGRTYVHFGNGFSDDYQEGDLVLCDTSGIHDWTVAFVEKQLGHSRALLREIGSDRLCDMTNEGFRKIIGLRESQLWEGAKQEFYIKVQKAFRKGSEYLYRFGGLKFNGRYATIWIREAFGGLDGSKPFSVEMRWNKKTTIKAILAAMREGGYGTRKFEKEEKEINEENHVHS